MAPDILYEDNHLLIVNKPFCMPSQGDDTGDLNVFDWAKEYIRVTYNKPGNVYCALLHRLDRPVGGVLALAKTSKAAARVSKDFQAKKIRKTYYAITEAPPPAPHGELVHYLRRVQGRNIIRAYDKDVAHSKKAVTRYRQIAVKDGRALLEVEPVTGRKHQIRVQLATMGCTIVGDKKYGKTEFLPDKSVALFARRLVLTHPVKQEELVVEAPLPRSGVWGVFKQQV